jgi:hypothetical protein
MVEGDRAVDIVAYLACYCLELRNEPSKYQFSNRFAHDYLLFVVSTIYQLFINVSTEPHGTSRVLAYMIQSITSEPAFGQQVNVPLRLPLPGKWSSNGTGTFVGGPAAEFYIYVRISHVYSIAPLSDNFYYHDVDIRILGRQSIHS